MIKKLYDKNQTAPAPVTIYKRINGVMVASTIHPMQNTGNRDKRNHDDDNSTEGRMLYGAIYNR